VRGKSYENNPPVISPEGFGVETGEEIADIGVKINIGMIFQKQQRNLYGLTCDSMSTRREAGGRAQSSVLPEGSGASCLSESAADDVAVAGPLYRGPQNFFVNRQHQLYQGKNVEMPNMFMVPTEITR
jgi:hypothetical protein